LLSAVVGQAWFTAYNERYRNEEKQRGHYRKTLPQDKEYWY
jgi:hypothetical protein